MTTKQYLEIIQMNHKDMISEDVQKNCQGTINELTKLKDTITQFFLDEKRSIQNVYAELGTGAYRYNMVSIIDLYDIWDVFRDYHNGMNEFCDTMLTLQQGDCVGEKEVSQKMDRIVKRDKVFRSNMFKKDDAMVEVGLAEGMGQIEFLIDFIPSIDNFCSELSAKARIVSSDTSPYKKDKVRTVTMLADLIRQYSYEVVKNIFIIFDGIVTSMEHKVSEAEHKMPRYSMFG